MRLMTDYLHERTALLPKVELREPDSVIGKSTDHAAIAHSRAIDGRPTYAGALAKFHGPRTIASTLSVEELLFSQAFANLACCICAGNFVAIWIVAGQSYGGCLRDVPGGGHVDPLRNS